MSKKKQSRTPRPRLRQTPPAKLKKRDVKALLRDYRQSLSYQEQEDLVSFICETRESELMRAYPDILDVHLGFGVEQDSKTGEPRIRDIPCVTFLVARKWRRKSEGKKSRRLPEYLLAHWRTPEGWRKFAVPTDVDDGAELETLAAQTPAAPVIVDPDTDEATSGVATCALRRDGGDELYVLGCKHVFNLSGRIYPANRWRAPVAAGQGHADIGRTTSIAGDLQNDRLFSFDAQLAKVENVENLLKSLGEFEINRAATRPGDIRSSYFIHGPDGPVRAEKRGYLRRRPLDYNDGRLDNVIHDQILESLCAPHSLRPGFSGAPLTSDIHGGVLLGMHFAGTDRRSFAIPAWQLFDPTNYRRASSLERWDIVSRAELIAGPDRAEGPPTTIASSPIDIAELAQNHCFHDSVFWRLAIDGVRIEDRPPEITVGAPRTVERVWERFAESIIRWCDHFSVPIELCIATICTESGGDPSAVRQEPSYVSDAQTPARVSVGLMQTLISTAQGELPDFAVDRTWLQRPDNSIRVGVSYLARQRAETMFDPPKAACAYNAGRLRYNGSHQNRWKMRQYPIGSSAHADRFVRWFNDIYRAGSIALDRQHMSFRTLFQRR